MISTFCLCQGMTLDFSGPGKPTDNGFIEAFNDRFRAVGLIQHWFLTLAHARQKMVDWRRCYNDEVRHGAIGNKGADPTDESGRRNQPASVNEAGKLQPPVGRRLGWFAFSWQGRY